MTTKPAGQMGIDEFHKKLLRNFPGNWSETCPASTNITMEDLEKILRLIMEGGDWGEKIQNLRSCLKDLGVRVE